MVSDDWRYAPGSDAHYSISLIAGLVDAGEKTGVTVFTIAYDTRDSEEGGCDPDGCVPSNTRDSLFTDNSRWSCVSTLKDTTCRCQM